MAALSPILLVFALVLFVIGAVYPPAPSLWHRVIAAGLACWVGASVILLAV
jgi:hypothetical protein